MLFLMIFINLSYPFTKSFQVKSKKSLPLSALRSQAAYQLLFQLLRGTLPSVRIRNPEDPRGN